jgi:hypothetical protein
MDVRASMMVAKKKCPALVPLAQRPDTLVSETPLAAIDLTHNIDESLRLLASPPEA